MGATLGLLVIGACALIAAVAGRTTIPVLRVWAPVVAAGLWLLAFVAFLWLLALEREPVASPSCPRFLGDSEGAPSHWSWLPPGTVCEFARGDVGPTLWRVPAALLIVAVPVVALLFARRQRDTDPFVTDRASVPD